MKKILLGLSLLITSTAFYAQCNDLFISEYAEGSNNNKAIEIFNPTPNPIALNNNYRLVRYNNGTGSVAGEANSQAIVNLGNVTINSGDVWVIVIDKRDPNQPCPGQECAVDLELQALADTFMCPDYNVSYSMYFNGNDALSLQKYNGSTWNYVDIFGMMGDPAMVTSQAWSDVFPFDGSAGTGWTKDHTLIRKASVQSGVTVNPSPVFNVTLEWDSLPNETWTNLGTHTCLCATNVEESAFEPIATAFPNPSENGRLFVKSDESISSVEMFNLMGQRVAFEAKNINSRLLELYAENASEGVYFVKVNYANRRSTTLKVTIE